MMYHRYALTFCGACMQLQVTKCNQKLTRGTFLLVFSARYFIMKCNNQRNLDISMAKVTMNLYVELHEQRKTLSFKEVYLVGF